MAITLHILILGDPAVGKTAFLLRHITGHYYSEYHPTGDLPEYRRLELLTSVGKVEFIFTCINSLDKPLPAAHAAFIMTNTALPTCISSGKAWAAKLKKESSMPYTVVATHCDLLMSTSVVKKLAVAFKGLPTYMISSKSNYNYDKPLLSAIHHFYPGTEFISCSA